MKYTQKQWDRIVGYGSVPKEYSLSSDNEETKSSDNEETKLSGYYEVIGVEHTEDCDHGSCILVEIKDDQDTIQIGFYYAKEPKQISVLKKGYHY